MRKIALKKLPTDKIKEMRKDSLTDEDIVKALKPDYSNQEVDDAFNQAAQSQNEDLLSELDQFEPIKSGNQNSQGSPEDLLEEAPAPEPEETSFSGYANVQTPAYTQPAQEFSSTQIQEIVEAVVEEKWDDFISKTGDINLWKESINNDIEAVKQEILRTQDRFNNLQNVLIGKVTDYNKTVMDLNSEMKALSQVMQKIVEPLTSNIKELNKITTELKKKKK